MIVSSSLPVISFVFSNRKISELLKKANSNKPIINFLYWREEIFQYFKNEKKFPFPIVVEGCFFSFNKKISTTAIIPGNIAKKKKRGILLRKKMQKNQ